MDTFLSNLTPEDFFYEIKNLEEKDLTVKKILGKFSFKQQKSINGSYHNLRPSLFPGSEEEMKAI